MTKGRTCCSRRMGRIKFEQNRGVVKERTQDDSNSSRACAEFQSRCDLSKREGEEKVNLGSEKWGVGGRASQLEGGGLELNDHNLKKETEK